VRYQILGPVELFTDGTSVRLGGPKQRAVLALLLLNANRMVAEQRFLTMVWGDDPPLSVRGQLQMYVSQLRKLIGGPVIVRRPPGYVMRVEPGELDLHVFDEKAGQARAALAAGRHEDALAGFQAALALWRGPALGGVTEHLIEREGLALSARRLAALEEYFDVRLDAGQHDQVMREVREAAEENPLRERLQAQLMLALHRSGRTSEALDLYGRTRTRLVTEQGTEPGPLLRDTHMRVLRDEDETAPPPAPPAPPPPKAPAPRQLPAEVPVFAGRVAELAGLDALLDTTGKVIVIGGGAGVGKTTLAVHWAHRVKERFPDGQLYMNLRGFDPSGNTATTDDVVRGFLAALNVPAPAIPASAAARLNLYRSVLADKRVLVVLDNVRDAEQVRPLLPGAPGCLTVVTSRDQLPSLIATEGAMPVMVGLMQESEARAMLVRRVGAARVEAEPDAVTRIIGLCAQLPLALAIVAARAATHPTFSLGSLADELRQDRGDLDVFDVGDSTTSVRAVFSWSYLTLEPVAARLFRLLGGHPGPHVTPAAAASLLCLPPRQARTALAELARAHLIVEASPGLFGFHDLLRAYATEFAHGEDEQTRHAALHRTLDHYLHTAAACERLLRPQQAVPMTLAPVQDGVTVTEIRTERDAGAWFGTEYAVLHALVALAARDGFDTYAYRLVDTLTTTLWFGGTRWLGDIGVHQTSLAAARRVGDPLGQALAHRALAVLHLTHERLADAETELVAALEFAGHVGDLGFLADIHQGLAKVTEGMGRFVDQREHTELALELFRAVGNDIGVANSYNNLAWCMTEFGDHERAVTLCKHALEMFAELRDLKGEANTWDTLGFANARLGHHDEAIRNYERAVELHRRIKSLGQEANAHRKIGDIHHDQGAFADARREWQQAVDMFEELGLRGRADALRDRLAAQDTS